MAESPAKLCELCQHAFLGSNMDGTSWRGYFWFHERPWEMAAQRQPGDTDAITDCDFCTFVVEHALSDRVVRGSGLGFFPDEEVSTGSSPSEHEELLYVEHMPWFDHQGHVSAAVELRRERYSDKPTLRIFGVSDPRMTHYEAIEHNSTATSGDASFRLLSHWMRNCSQNHHRCSKLHTRKGRDAHWLPTRLLRIVFQADGAPERVQVLETAKSGLGSDTCYATLSYCWGENPSFLKLTRANLQTLKQTGVRIQDLPATFHDAIAAANRLGFRYLWVDALCIIQDSAEDWARESVTMAKVYSYSSVTLAAAASEDAEGGLFRCRNPAAVNGARVDLQWPELGLEGQCRIVPADPWQTAVLKSPLLKRAWVFQERLLSRGTVFFAHDMLYWECGELYASELYPGGGPWDMPFREMRFDIELVARRKFRMIDDGRFKHIYTALLTKGREDNSSPLDELVLEPFLHVWASIVTQYSQGSLRFESDKLVAIDGVVQQMATVEPKAPYSGGFWQQPNLPLLLLWYTMDITTRAWIPGAPSWSWASTHSGIHFDFLFLAASRPEISAQVVTCSTLSDHSTTTTSADSHKPETSRTMTKLTLKGQMTEIRIHSFTYSCRRPLHGSFWLDTWSDLWNPGKCNGRSMDPPEWGVYIAVGKAFKLKKSTVFFDRYFPKGTRVFALKAAEAELSLPSRTAECGLLLAPASALIPEGAAVDDRGTFVRVGYFEIEEKSLCRDMLDWRALFRWKSFINARRNFWSDSRIEKRFWQEWDGKDNYTITIL